MFVTGSFEMSLKYRYVRYFVLSVRKYCITRIFRVEEIFAIFSNLDFARNFPPAK